MSLIIGGDCVSENVFQINHNFYLTKKDTDFIAKYWFDGENNPKLKLSIINFVLHSAIAYLVSLPIIFATTVTLFYCFVTYVYSPIKVHFNEPTLTLFLNIGLIFSVFVIFLMLCLLMVNRQNNLWGNIIILKDRKDMLDYGLSKNTVDKIWMARIEPPSAKLSDEEIEKYKLLDKEWLINKFTDQEYVDTYLNVYWHCFNRKIKKTGSLIRLEIYIYSRYRKEVAS